jgi:hypothetical protein
MLPTEKLNALTEPTRDAARLLAETALDGSERLITLSIDAAQDAFDAGTAQLRDTWSDLAQVDPMAWPTLLAGSLWRGNALNRSWADIGSRLQREMASAVGAQMQAFQESATDAFGAYSRLVTNFAGSVQADEEQEVVEVKRRRAA